LVRRGVAALTRVGLAGVVMASVLDCRLILGSLHECNQDSDCAGRNAFVPTCISNLCVENPGCSVIGSTDPTAIVFGFIFPFTTPQGAPFPGGLQEKQTVELVLDELNPPKAEGLGGRPARVIACDDQEDSTTAARIASILISKGVPAILTDGSTDLLNVSAVAVPAGVLSISGSALSPEITGLEASPHGVRLVWRTSASDAIVMPVVAQQLQAFGHDGNVSAAMFVRDDAYGQGDYTALSSAFPADAGSVTPYFFQPGGSDVDSVFAKLASDQMQAHYDVLSILGFQDDYENILNAQDMSFATTESIPWYFTQGGRFPGLLTSVQNGDRLVGVRGAWSLEHINSPAYQWLANNLNQAFGFDPSGVQYVPNVFDAMMLLAVAAGELTVKTTSVDGMGLAEQLGRVSDLDGSPDVALDPPGYNVAVSDLAGGMNIDVTGASGNLDFNAKTGEAPADIEIWKVLADGGFAQVTVVPP
jgi:ABC-type branched-subunit amino acid transport system substrate-binding protein